jgi:hypothetical protein
VPPKGKKRVTTKILQSVQLLERIAELFRAAVLLLFLPLGVQFRFCFPFRLNHPPSKNELMILFANDDSAPRGQGGSQESIARAHEPRGAPFDSPVRATKFQTRNAGPAGLPLHRDRERERAVAACAHGASRLPASVVTPVDDGDQRADCSTACRATSRSSASRIHQCGHPSIACCTVACVPSTHPVASARSDDMSYIYTR